MWPVLLFVSTLLIGRTCSWTTDVDCLTVDGSEGRCTLPSECAPLYNGHKPHYCRYSIGYGTRVCCPRPLTNSVSNIERDLPENFYSSNEPLSFPSESYNQYRPSSGHPSSSDNSPLLFNEDSDFSPFNPRPSQEYRPNYENEYSSPSQGNRPNNGNNYNNPFQGSRPIYSSQESRPGNGNNYNNPSQGNSNRPNSGNHHNKPSQGNNYNNPSQGNNYYNPSQGNNYNNPSQGNRPNNENNFNSPSSGNQGRPNNNGRPQAGAWEIPGSQSPQSNHGRRTTPRPTWQVEGSRPTNSNSNKRVSEIKCEEYSISVTESIDVLPLSIEAEAVPLRLQKCDFSAVKLIVGGEASELGEFPHMAAIGFQSRGSQIMWNCGGTLISDRYVLTAAHCINTTYGYPVLVRLGEYNLARDNDGAEPKDYRIENFIVHPNYVKAYKYNDIALIRLSQPVRFNKGIRPACLPTDDKIRSKPTATGWGRTDFVGKQSDILMKVNLNVIDNRQCNSYYSTKNPGSQSFNKGIVDTMLCAGEVQGGRDTCMGDSGGPLTVTKKDNPCIHYVVGITSFGRICAAPESPGVYTKVFKYLSWIERTVWQQ